MILHVPSGGGEWEGGGVKYREVKDLRRLQQRFFGIGLELTLLQVSLLDGRRSFSPVGNALKQRLSTVMSAQ